jgi:transketolase
MSEQSVTESDRFIELDARCINAIRFLSADAVENANSGHPGMPMGAAAMAYVLWSRHLRHNPKDPGWINRDRFVLSAGHGSMLLYSLLHLTGYELPMEELKNFRQWGSKTPGHPENFLTDGIETTTGPLGQGFATGVGMAIAEQYLAAHLNRPGYDVVDHYTYAIVSDGDLMEGVASEAASLAGHLGLGKMIYLYDDNEISIDGSTELAFTEDVEKRFEAYGWHVQSVSDGNDLEAIHQAILEAKQVSSRPSIISVRTTIGYGAPGKEGTAAAHGEPLGQKELTAAKERLGWPVDQPFFVPDEVYEAMRSAITKGAHLQNAWSGMVDEYAAEHAEAAGTLRTWFSGVLPEGWDADLPEFKPGEKVATRAVSGKVLGAIVPRVQNLIGGSADLTPSNKTDVKGRSDFQRDSRDGGYLRFGVREHAMAAASNGITLHGGLRAYCGTFLIFSDYLRPSLRLSALMKTPVIYVFTHDSIGLGEDGPTHQPVEHTMALRCIPNLVVFRPADAVETVEAWRVAMSQATTPVALLLTRQNVPTFDRAAFGTTADVASGAYILSDSAGAPELILIGTGSEVQHLVDAAETLRAEGTRVRVVSMPSWELFEKQPDAYRESVLPSSVTRRITMEAGITLGWERYAGLSGRMLGLNRFGSSAPAEVLMEKFGFTAGRVLEVARELLAS